MHILVVEDNDADAYLTVKALQAADAATQVSVVPDGVEALAFLQRLGSYATAARPDLILLDLNLPRKDGRELLVEMRALPSLRRLPICIFTASSAARDITATYAAGATCYLVKPADLDERFAQMRALVEFWGRWVRLPQEQ